MPVGQSLCLGHPKLISSAIDCVGRRNQPSVKYDLPSGSRRLHQTTDGIDATIVNGVPIFIAGEPTVRVTCPDSCIWQAMVLMRDRLCAGGAAGEAAARPAVSLSCVSRAYELRSVAINPLLPT